jgi:methionine salvage enolase-phosphatase E1
MFKNFEDALIGKIKRKKYEPNKNTFKVYQRGFDMFKKVLEKNLPLYDYAKGR